MKRLQDKIFEKENAWAIPEVEQSIVKKIKLLKIKY